jgi:hypothetical protein
MIKNLRRIILLTLICFSSITSAQVPNAGFESWLNGSPVDWQTTNIPIVPSAVLPDSDSFSGTLAVKGTVVSTNNGMPYQPYLGISGPGSTGFEISSPFTQVNGNLKLFLHPGDRFVANLKMYNILGEPIAQGTTVIDYCVNNWTFFTVTANYYLPDPHSCSLYFTITDSTQQASGHIGSYFILDDLNMSGNVSVTAKQIEKSINIFPNPATDHFKIDWPEAADLNFTIYDQSGRDLSGIRHTKNKESIPLDIYSSGIYYLNITDNKETTITKKLVID